MKQGMEKGIKESIARLLKKGILPEQVCDLLDVSPEMVAEVQQDLIKVASAEEEE